MAKSKQEIQKSEAQIYELRKSVRYDIRELVLENIVDKYERGLNYTEDDDEQDSSKFYNVLFIPEYQRDFTWDTLRQSKFIESIILGLPIPLIFVAETPHTLEAIKITQQYYGNLPEMKFRDWANLIKTVKFENESDGSSICSNL